MNDLSLLRKLLAALVLAGAAVLILPACSSTEESSDSVEDEIKDEADAGTR